MASKLSKQEVQLTSKIILDACKDKVYRKNNINFKLFTSILLMYLYIWTELDRTYLYKNIKKNVFYEMLSYIKAYQSDTVSQCSPSQNSPSCCTQVVCLQNDHFWFWLVAVMFVYIHTKCSDFND